MDDTKKTVAQLLVSVGILILLYLLVVFVAGVVQIAEAADRLYLGAGQPIFFGLMLFLVTFASSPFYLYFKFPRTLTPPSKTSGPEFDKYIAQLKSRLRKNPRLQGVALESEEDIKAALGMLSKEAECVIKTTAKNVFLGTAISQNGRLDGLIMLASQGKMVWQVACVYSQRPSPRELIYLYSNVASSALLAESLDDIDISELTGPLFNSLGMGVVAAVPGASIVMNSIASGTANAFLTLRVGSISIQYCESITKPKRSLVRRTATLVAANQVLGIAKENSGALLSVIRSIASKSAGAVVDTVKSTAGKVSDAVSKTASNVGNTVEAVIDDALIGVKSTSGKSGEYITEKKDEIGAVMGNGITEIKAVSGKTTTKLSQAIITSDGSINAIKNSTRNATNSISDNASAVGNAVGEAMGDALSGVKNTSKNTAQYISQKTEKVSNSIGNALGGIKVVAGKTTGGVSQGIHEK